ncbi:MAG: electron transport complex subunit RsxG [Kistimonas sp.]|nr:electron transport complex subunit RsxG [Kistimonas sp.]
MRLASTPLTRALVHNSVRLALFALLTTGLVSLTWIATRSHIASQIRSNEEKTLKEVLPDDPFDNILGNSRLTLPAPEQLGWATSQPQGWFACRDSNIEALVLPVVAPDGYSGQIRLLVAIDRQGTLTGVRATAHRETPGLGDGIETRVSGWIRIFSGKSLNNPTRAGWAVTKDGGQFDQFTGATITPRAVVTAVYRTLVYFSHYRNRLLGFDDHCPPGKSTAP